MNSESYASPFADLFYRFSHVQFNVDLKVRGSLQGLDLVPLHPNFG